MKKKIIFVAHPIAGDVEENMKKVLTLCEKIHNSGFIPIAPYIVSLQYLNDTITEDRELGIEVNSLFFEKKFIDELWLFGNKISRGMWGEIKLARKFNIPIVAKTKNLKQELLGKK
jgi:hypothetical protein